MYDITYKGQMFFSYVNKIYVYYYDRIEWNTINTVFLIYEDDFNVDATIAWSDSCLTYRKKREKHDTLL